MMKNRIYQTILFAVVLVFISCTTDEDTNSNNSTADIQEITNLVVSGTWRITNFIDSGSDETSDFDSYGFSFNTDGSLVADNGVATINGTWSVTGDDSDDDDSDHDSSDDDDNDDVDFNIFFANPSGFNELSEDWHFVSRSNTKIELIHESSHNGGSDMLTFERN